MVAAITAPADVRIVEVGFEFIGSTIDNCQSLRDWASLWVIAARSNQA